MWKAAWLAAGSAAVLGSMAPGVLAVEIDALDGARTGPARAQPADESAAEPSADSALSGLSFRLRSGGIYSAEADLDAGAGKVAVGRLGTALAISGQPDDRSTLTFEVGSEFSFYDFSDVATLLPGGGDPIGDAARYSLGLSYSRSLDDHWGLFVGGTVEFVPASGASWGDSVLGSGVVGATYEVHEGLRIGLGAAVSSRLEDDARILPLPFFDWQINDRWSLRTADRAVDVRGLQLAYKATDAIELFALAGWNSHEFRLDNKGAVPDGVFRDERIPVVGGIAWSFMPQAKLELAAGVDAWSNYQILDATGAKLADVDADPALTGWLGVTIKF